MRIPGYGSRWLLLIVCLGALAPSASAQGVAFDRNDYAAGGQPSAVIIADFNGDGKLDLAVANFGSNNVSILLGNGTGGFSAQTTFATGMGPASVAAGDFNGDTKLDLVTANLTDNTVSILLGNGDGTFGAPTSFATGNGPVFVAVGKFNVDNNLDLAVANQGSDSISVLLGNGDGTFGAKTDFLTGSQPSWLIVADFNGDSKLDLASANPSSNTVSILLGNGNGTFATKSDFATGLFPRAVAAADFRNLTRMDLATANQTDNTASILLSRGDGTFDPRMDLGTDTEPLALTAADFDNDGKPDLLTSNADLSSYLYTGAGYGCCYIYYYFSTVSFLRGNGDGSFSSPTNFSLGVSLGINRSPVSVAAADLNGDSRIDVVTANAGLNSVSVLLQVPDISLSTGQLDFPTNQAVGTTSPSQTVTVSSTGSFDLVISTVSIIGTNPGDFSKVGDTCSAMSIASGGNCQVQVTFTPTASGARNATLRIPDNAPGNPHDVSLSGAGAGNGIVSPSPASVGFGDQFVGSSSFRDILLTNTGTGPITILSIFVEGDSAFFLFSNGCFPPLAASTSCPLSVGFSTSTLGMHSASLHIDSDTLASPTLVSLTANGIPLPTYSLSPTGLNFGDQRVGTTSAPQIVMLTNTGTSPLTIFSISVSGDFAQMNDCPISPATLAPSAMCTISVTFSPSFDDVTDGFVQIDSNASGSPTQIFLSGTGIAPHVGLSAASLTFAGQLVGTTSPAQSVTLMNTGSDALTITSIGITGANSADFTAMHNCPLSPTTLAVNGTCTISITFTPSATGARSTSVTVSSDDPDGPQTAGLNGTGIAPNVMLSPTSLTFSAQLLSTTSSAQAITLTNNGSAALTIISIGVTGSNSGDFAAMHNCPLSPATLAVNGNCTINITFTPSAGGARSALLSVSSDAPGSPHTATLSGTGVTPPSVTLSATMLTFMAQVVGTTSAAQTVILTNTGGSVLTITSIVREGTNAADFNDSNNCGTSVAAEANCTITVAFGPQTGSLGARSAVIMITDNASDSPQQITLSGTGTDFSVMPSPGTPTSMTINAGDTATFSLSLAGQGGFSGTVTFNCTGTIPAGTCTSPAPTMLGMNPVTVTVSATTMRRGVSLPREWRQPPPLMWFLLLLMAVSVPMLGRLSRPGRILAPQRRVLAGALPLAVLLLAVVFSASCSGGGGGVVGTPAGTYPLAVNATSGGATRAINLTVTVR